MNKYISSIMATFFVAFCVSSTAFGKGIPASMQVESSVYNSAHAVENDNIELSACKTKVRNKKSGGGQRGRN